jgi:DNA-binding transcriptional MerR regulator
MVLRFKDLGMTLEEIRTLVETRKDPLDSGRLQSLKDALILRKTDFEERIRRYQEGIMQIDAVVEQLSRCNYCGAPREKEVCQSCLSEKGEDISPLLDPLIE